jgi:hypothetical protein
MTSEISQRLKGKQDSSNPTESERRKKMEKWVLWLLQISAMGCNGNREKGGVFPAVEY